MNNEYLKLAYCMHSYNVITSKKDYTLNGYLHNLYSLCDSEILDECKDLIDTNTTLFIDIPTENLRVLELIFINHIFKNCGVKNLDQLADLIA